MSHHSGIESDQKDLTKSINEAAFNKGSGNVTITDSNIYVTAGGNFGDIQHKDNRRTITALEVADNGSTIRKRERDTTNTLNVLTRPDNISAEETATTDSPAAKRKAQTPEMDKGCIQLSDSIWFYKERRLASAKNVFEGVEKNEPFPNEPFPNRQLAIKCFWNYTPKNLREAKNLKKLTPHTNVVAIVRTGAYKGMPGVDCLYIAMEKCNTLNLEDYIKERRAKNVPFNPDEAFEHAKQVIDAINHIHGHNIMHRDLKPSSVLFSLCGRYLKICDFGLSKELKFEQTVTVLSTLSVGTDGYRAPETYNEDVISKMADIFSLALVLYHLLSYGFHPFGIDPDTWKLNIKNKDHHPDLSRLRAPFLKIVTELLEKMLNFKPKDRLKIDQVKNSECMKLGTCSLQALVLIAELFSDWFPLIIENLVPIWNGAVQDQMGADMLSCRLYRSPGLQDVIEIDEPGWKFQMKALPFPIGSLKKVTDEESSGYIVTSKDELTKVTGKLAGNLVGWIDITKHGKDPKVIVLLYQRGYPELFGIFFPDKKILTSLIKDLADKQSLTSQKPAADPEASTTVSSATKRKRQPSETDKAWSSNSDQTRESSSMQDQSAASADQSSEVSAASAESALDPTKEAANQRKPTTRGLIPWWIYTGDLKK